MKKLRLREIKWLTQHGANKWQNWDQSLESDYSNSSVPPLSLILASLPNPSPPQPRHLALFIWGCQPPSQGHQSGCILISPSAGFKNKRSGKYWCPSHMLPPTLEVTYNWGGQAFQSQTQTPESLCLGAFSVHRAERGRLEVQEN